MDLNGGQLLHILAVAILLAIFLSPKTKARGAKPLLLLAIGFFSVILGIGYNAIVDGAPLTDQLTFHRVSYGSYFISLGYALLLFAAYLFIRALGASQ